MSEEHSESSTPGRSWLDRITQFFSGEPASGPRSRDDLLSLLHSLRDRQLLEEDTLHIIEGAVEISGLQVRDIMTPRPQMVTLRASAQPRDFLPCIIESAHSRLPVLGDESDEILGILLAKDLLPLILDPALMDGFDLRAWLRPAFIIPESKRVDLLLRDFRDSHHHMAIVVNEYGGIAGLVTIEDVLEQIVGDIEDETDTDNEDFLIRELDQGSCLVQAQMPIEDFNEHFGCDLDDDEFDTVGGLVMQQFGRLPEPGEQVEFGGFQFTVVNADARTIRQLQVTPLNTPAA